MAFLIERVAMAAMAQDVVQQLGPAEDVVRATDPRVATLTPFLPWISVAGPAGMLFLLGEDHLAGLFYDELGLSEAVLSTSPAIAMAD